MKLFTKLSYAGQTLHLPVVGEVTLDKEASLEIKDEKEADQLIDVTKGGLSFYKTKEEANVKVSRKSIEVNNETVIIKSPRQRLGELLQEVGVTQIRQWIDEVFPVAKSEPDKSSIVEDKKEDNTNTQEIEETPSNAEEMVNPEDIKEGIDSCDSVEELLGLVDLIPGVKKKDTKGKSLEELKSFLKSQVDKALSKK